MRVNERLEDAQTNAMEKQTKRKCEKRKRAREKRSEEKGRINKERKEKKEQGALLHPPPLRNHVHSVEHSRNNTEVFEGDG
jgi:hypothetical protein